ncbi:hypothetical protein ACXYN8_11235 [Altererythrobacter sp. CAU 1778]
MVGFLIAMALIAIATFATLSLAHSLRQSLASYRAVTAELHRTETVTVIRRETAALARSRAGRGWAAPAAARVSYGRRAAA